MICEVTLKLDFISLSTFESGHDYHLLMRINNSLPMRINETLPIITLTETVKMRSKYKRTCFLGKNFTALFNQEMKRSPLKEIFSFKMT